MSELRQNLATKEWVVISTERGKKPNAVLNKIIGTPVSDKDYDPECPFCPGNESRFPLEERYRKDDAAGNWAKDSMLVTVNNFGITENRGVDKIDRLEILPNPNRGHFVLNTVLDVKVYNANGQLITSGRGPFTGFNPGIYFVVCGDGNNVICKKVVVIE